MWRFVAFSPEAEPRGVLIEKTNRLYHDESAPFCATTGASGHRTRSAEFGKRPSRTPTWPLDQGEPQKRAALVDFVGSGKCGRGSGAASVDDVTKENLALVPCCLTTCR
jgi:hypothetical protein